MFSSDREKPITLKKKIKALESQIDQKNSLLTSIKQNEVLNDEKLKVLKQQNEIKLKTMNSSIARLQQENSLLKSNKPVKNQYYLPPIRKISSKNHYRNVSAGPKLQKNYLNDEDKQTIEEKPEFASPNKENSARNEEGNNEETPQKQSNLNVSTLTKQLELLKKENERLKHKNKQINDKFHMELASKEKELLELRRLKIDFSLLTDKFEILAKRNKPKETSLHEADGGNSSINNTKDESLMFLNKRIKDLNKAIEGKVQENDKVKEEINRFKLKARSLLTEKKRAMEVVEKTDKECQCNGDDLEKIDYNSEKFTNNKPENIQNNNDYNENIALNSHNNKDVKAKDQQATLTNHENNNVYNEINNDNLNELKHCEENCNQGDQGCNDLVNNAQEEQVQGGEDHKSDFDYSFFYF